MSVKRRIAKYTTISVGLGVVSWKWSSLYLALRLSIRSARAYQPLSPNAQEMHSRLHVRIWPL